MSTKSRLVRVFISSTFRDFIQERDELVKKVFPELRRRCKERFVELLEVDLRWGITEEQAKGGETLRICLEEIDRCRPSAPVFFVGLLGERYGWIPPKEFFTKEVLKDPNLGWVKEHIEGKSVTELEILHGVLRNEAMRDKAFFYFRNDGYQDRHWPQVENHHRAIMPPVTKEDFTNAKSEHGKAEDDRKQRELKQAIRDASLAWDPRNYEAPEDMGRMVLEDLWAAIDRVFPAGEVPDENERHRLEHDAFGQSRTKAYVNRAGLFEKLDVVLSAEESPVVAVTGESGGGKSALLAAWLEQLDRSAPSRRFVHYIGGTPESSSAKSIVLRLLNQIRAWGAVSNPVPDDFGQAVDALPEWLALAAAGQDGGLLLVLDALNQLESSRDRSLWWLPKQMPPGVRLVLSTLPGESEQELRARGWLENELRVPPLNDQERKQIIAGYLGRFTKKLDRKLVDRLACAPQACNPLFLRVVLDELRIRARHEELGPMLERMLEAKDPAELFVQVLKNLEEFDKERKNLVREAMGYLAVARRGLSEDELLQLLSDDPQPSSNPLPRHYWSPLYLALEDSLVSRNGQLSFFHDYLQQAAEREYLDEDWERKRVHGRLGEVAEVYDSEKFSPALRRYSLAHGAWHLRSAGERERLWQLLSGDGYWRAQFDEFARADEAVEGLRHGIDFYAERNGEEAVDDARLCALALACGETVDAARASLEPVFSDFMRRNLDDPSRVEDAISRLQILDGSVYWLAAQLLIFIECHRSGPEADNSATRRLEMIIESVEAKVAPETEVLVLVWLEEALATGLPSDLYIRLAKVTDKTVQQTSSGQIEQGSVAGSAPRWLMPMEGWKALFACRALLKKGRWQEAIRIAELCQGESRGWMWDQTMRDEIAEMLARKGRLGDALAEPSLQSVFQMREESASLRLLLQALLESRYFFLAAEIGTNTGVIPRWFGGLLIELQARQHHKECGQVADQWAGWAKASITNASMGDGGDGSWVSPTEMFVRTGLQRIADELSSLGKPGDDITDTHDRDQLEISVTTLCFVGLGFCQLGEKEKCVEVVSSCLDTVPFLPEAQRSRVISLVSRLVAISGNIRKAGDLICSLREGYGPRDQEHEFSVMTVSWHRVVTIARILGDAASGVSASARNDLLRSLQQDLSDLHDDELVSALAICLRAAARLLDAQLKDEIYLAAKTALSCKEKSGSTWQAAIALFAEVGESDTALEWARELEVSEEKARSLAIAASAILHGGADEARATLVWQEALNTAATLHSDHAKVRATNAIAETVAQTDEKRPRTWKNSLRRHAADLTRESSLEPELKAVRYAALGHAYHGVGDETTGEALMREAVALTRSIPVEEGKAFGSFVCFAGVWGETDPLKAAGFLASGINAFAGVKTDNLDIYPVKETLARAFISTNRLHRALSLVSDLHSGGHEEARALWMAMAQAARDSKWQPADAAPVELLASCLSTYAPDEFWDAVCGTVAQSFAWPEVEQALANASAAGPCHADVLLLRLLETYLRDSRFAEADQVASYLGDYRQSDVAEVVAYFLTPSSHRDKLEELFLRGLQAASREYADLKRAVLLRRCASLLDPDKVPAEVLTAIDERVRREIATNPMNAEPVARGLAVAARIFHEGNLEESATAAIREACDAVTAASVTDQSHAGWMLGGIMQETMLWESPGSTDVDFKPAVRGGASARDRTQALLLLREAAERLQDEGDKSRLLRDVTIALASTPNGLDAAIDVYPTISNSWYLRQACSVLAETLYASNRREEALGLIDAVGGQDGATAVVLAKIGLLAQRQRKQGLSAADPMDLFVKGIEKLEAHPHANIKAMWLLAETLVLVDDFPTRESMFRRLVAAADSITQPWLAADRSRSFASIAGVIARAGQKEAGAHLFREALDAAKSANVKHQASVLSLIILSMISSRTPLAPWIASFREAVVGLQSFEFLHRLPLAVRRAWFAMDEDAQLFSLSSLNTSWLGSFGEKIAKLICDDADAEREVIRALISLCPESNSINRRLVAELAAVELRAGCKVRLQEITALCPSPDLQNLTAA